MENHENQWPPDILMQETNFQYLHLTVSLFPLEWQTRLESIEELLSRMEKNWGGPKAIWEL